MLKAFSLMMVMIFGMMVFRFFFLMAVYQDGRPVESNLFVKVLIAPFVNQGQQASVGSR